MPAPMAAWLAETGSVTRRPGPLARASHGMDAAAQDTANRMLIASTGAGLAARDMDAIAPRAAPVACLPVAAGAVPGHPRPPPPHQGRHYAGHCWRPAPAAAAEAGNHPTEPRPP